MFSLERLKNSKIKLMYMIHGKLPHWKKAPQKIDSYLNPDPSPKPYPNPVGNLMGSIFRWSNLWGQFCGGQFFAIQKKINYEVFGE